MGALLDPATRSRLIGVLSRLSSDFDGERAAAGLLASRLMKAHNLTWDDLVPAPPALQTQTDYTDHTECRADRMFCLRNLPELTEWESGFVQSVASRRRLSPKQIAVLQRIATMLRERGRT